jgi:hypothetical protein
LHHFSNSLERKKFFDKSEIPLNGVYLLYEEGEKGHGTDRIVRVGTHTGVNNFPSRLDEHFIKENKDRSIFRKNIGRAILNKTNDDYLKVWNLKSPKAKDKHLHAANEKRKAKTESFISVYFKEKISFVVLREDEKKKRLELKSKIISTISQCRECKASPKWMGLNSPIEKIRESGLWQVQHLNKEQFTKNEIETFIKKYG